MLTYSDLVPSVLITDGKFLFAGFRTRGAQGRVVQLAADDLRTIVILTVAAPVTCGAMDEGLALFGTTVPFLQEVRSCVVK